MFEYGKIFEARVLLVAVKNVGLLTSFFDLLNGQYPIIRIWEMKLTIVINIIKSKTINGRWINKKTVSIDHRKKIQL